MPDLKLQDLKQRLAAIEAELAVRPCVHFLTLDSAHGSLSVWLTARLRKACRRGRVWQSTAMLTALKNVGYGFDRSRPRSRRGMDGVFRLDREFRPRNEMMRKLFDRFLDRPDALVALLAEKFSVDAATFVPVRVVSHHMRLLGVLVDGGTEAQLVLVDYDDGDG